MAVRVKDLLNLEIMKDFSVVAGKKGLNRVVHSTEILDFEFTLEGEAYRKKSFEGNSIVLSVLLFAKDKPELILDAVKKLVAQNVQALAYKPVFFKALPKEALAYAEEMNFPILEFGHDEFLEDVIIAVRDLIDKDGAFNQTELLIGQMLEQELTAERSGEICQRLNPFFRPLIAVVFAAVEGVGPEQAEELLKADKISERMQSRTFIGRYKDKYMIVLSQDEDNSSCFKAQLEDMLTVHGLAGRRLTMGISEVRRKNDRFDAAVREAFWAEKTAEIEKENVKYYKDLGIYKLIISHINSRSTSEYMRTYLAPLFEEEEREGELLKTAVEYILAKGDIGRTAQRLFCHKNTIRYRIGKLQEKLDPNAGEKEFYLNLAAAIKIYLLTSKEE